MLCFCFILININSLLHLVHSCHHASFVLWPCRHTQIICQIVLFATFGALMSSCCLGSLTTPSHTNDMPDCIISNILCTHVIMLPSFLDHAATHKSYPILHYLIRLVHSCHHASFVLRPRRHTQIMSHIAVFATFGALMSSCFLRSLTTLWHKNHIRHNVLFATLDVLMSSCFLLFVTTPWRTNHMPYCIICYIWCNHDIMLLSFFDHAVTHKSYATLYYLRHLVLSCHHASFVLWPCRNTQITCHIALCVTFGALKPSCFLRFLTTPSHTNHMPDCVICYIWCTHVIMLPSFFDHAVTHKSNARLYN